MTETQIEIIKAAEVEFAQHGFAGASVREITKRAKVNIAAINYHFGGKRELFKAMVRYRIEPINAKRIAMLDAAYAASGMEPLPLRQVVDIIVRPLVTQLIGTEGEDFQFMTAMGRALTEEREFMFDLHRNLLAEILKRFHAALAHSLKGTPEKEVFYSLHFLSCSMIGAMNQHARLGIISHGNVDLKDIDALVDRLTRFITGGIEAIANTEE